MKYYIVRFKSGLVVSGNAHDIVQKMREASFLERGLTNAQYRRNFTRRHNMLYRPRVGGITENRFVKSLAGSPIVISYREMEA